MTAVVARVGEAGDPLLPHWAALVRRAVPNVFLHPAALRAVVATSFAQVCVLQAWLGEEGRLVGLWALQQSWLPPFGPCGLATPPYPKAFLSNPMVDPEVTRKRMEKLLAKVEDLLPAAQQRAQTRQLSPTELLAEKWRERLAANTIAGSRAAEENEELRWRNAEQEVRSAQAQWSRLGPMPADIAGPLNEKFQRAVRRFYDSRRKAS